MCGIDGRGRFTMSHALLLLAGCRANKLSNLGISDIHDSVALGNGSDFVARLLTSETLGFTPDGFSVRDLERIILLERPKLRKVAVRFSQSQSPPS